MDPAQIADRYFKIASILSPFMAAALTGAIAYYVGKKGKKWDILYANKVPTLKIGYSSQKVMMMLLSVDFIQLCKEARRLCRATTNLG